MTTITTPKCFHCGKTSQVEVTPEQFQALINPNRPLIQLILPDWTAEQRELLITGTHPECWKQMLPEPDDDPEDEMFGEDPYDPRDEEIPN